MSKYEVNVIDEYEQEELQQYVEQVKTAVSAALSKCEAEENSSVNLLFCDDARITRLNSAFRGKNNPTDCLSFPSGESNNLGDIAVNVNRAFKQAKQYAHSPLRELCFLAVHSTLHLMGYDHEPDEAEMFALQEEILNEIGINR